MVTGRSRPFPERVRSRMRRSDGCCTPGRAPVVGAPVAPRSPMPRPSPEWRTTSIGRVDYSAGWRDATSGKDPNFSGKTPERGEKKTGKPDHTRVQPDAL